MDDTIVEQGRRSYRADGKKMNNPYDFGSREYDDFERGWVQACKRDGSLNSDGIAYTSMISEQGQYDASKDARQREARAYAKAKGA